MHATKIFIKLSLQSDDVFTHVLNTKKKGNTHFVCKGKACRIP